jgi:glyoxylase-like metal-dependent hydrolase (beta-lactamase superfamily II)
MQVIPIVVGEFESNCFLVSGNETDAIVIDPGADDRAIDAQLSREGLTPAAYVLTHGHMDHVSAAGPLADRHPAPVYAHPLDLHWAFTEVNQMPPFYRTPRSPTQSLLIPLEDGALVSHAGLTLRVIATPGHTPGGICLYDEVHRVVFTGDTLFAGSVGRTDLPGGDSRTLSRSLGALARLPDDTLVYPGHGSATTIGREKKTNYFLGNV